METCQNCEWYYKEHCSNGKSDNCTEAVGADDYCEWYENKLQEVEK